MNQEKKRKNILSRLKTVRGHIQGIEKMIEEEKACEEILLQVGAVKSSMDKICQIIIEDHAKECLLRHNITTEEIEKILKTIVKFSK